MKSLTGISDAFLYRLGGRIDDVDFVFDVSLGEHRIGSSSQSDIRLPVDSVSREHAVLSVTTNGLAIEDRGSKNGTFVNGLRVERAELAAGARVAFGPAELAVEQVDAEDVELAFTVEAGEDSRPRPSSTLRPTRETDSFIDSAERPLADTWLRAIEVFAQRLFATPEGDPNAALGYLLETLRAAGSCVIEWHESGAPIVLATRGSALRGALEEMVAPPPGLDEISFHSQAAGTVACLRIPGKPALGLMVWEDFDGREQSEILFRPLLRLLERLRPWTIHRAAVDGSVVAGRETRPELSFPDDYLPGTSPAMVALYRQMRALLEGDLPILITGPTGVGKERLASILHRSSDRRDGPLVAINCAAIPADLLEAELFGIGKGVATGVVQRKGKFQLAEGGTLLLDEIGELAPPLQAKLLRALQEKQIQPVGGRPQRIDVRILAATNADLDNLMDRGDFRRDLYYRLAGYALTVPPLRECPQDIPPLIEYFFRGFAGETRKRVRGITVKALRLLSDYSWPGNVRELQHEIRRLVYLCPDGGVLDAAQLSPAIVSADLDKLSEPGTGSLHLMPRLRQLESRLIREALQRTRGRRVHAARLLGISRNGLADKIKRLCIDPRAYRGRGD